MLTLMYVLLWLAIVAYVAHLTTGGRWLGWTATGATVLTWSALTAGLVTRGLEAGHWPLTNRYEFALSFLWLILIVYVLLETDRRERRTGTFVLIVALLIATYALLRPADEQAIRPLLPVLRSIWLQIHVISAAIGSGICAVAAGFGVMSLMRSRLSVRWELPPEEESAYMLERLVTMGFLWLTFSILSGAIWAQHAWGRYWGWDPKEIWSLITWLWYLLILHVRGLRDWRGQRLAGLIVAGFAIVFFTFAGLPWFLQIVRLESLHGF